MRYIFNYQFKFLVTGCSGQVGTALIPTLYNRFGLDNVLCTDIVPKPSHVTGKYLKLDVTDKKEFDKIVVNNGSNYIIHMAGILSGILKIYNFIN